MLEPKEAFLLTLDGLRDPQRGSLAFQATSVVIQLGLSTTKTPQVPSNPVPLFWRQWIKIKNTDHISVP